MVTWETSYLMLGEPDRSALVVKPISPVAPDIPVGLLTGHIRPSSPIRFVHHMGSKPTDFLDTSLAIVWLISEGVVSALRQNNLTGWSLFPVEVFGKNSKALG